MSVLSGKNIILGVTAGIAAYKSAFLTRLLIKKGANVKVVMTPTSKEFVTPLTLSTLSKNEVYSSFTSEDDDNAQWNNHVDIAQWGDLFIIAPATANTMSKMVSGTCDNLLLAVYLSAKCPVYYAPAMDLDMYKHPSTKDTFNKLNDFGNFQIPAEVGELASGLSGMGRMAEPQNIVSFVEKNILDQLPLKNKCILITAGPTYESIDPVRFIGNHSSGKMGYALAEVAASLGAQVKLISGPVSIKTNNEAIQVINVSTAEEMYKASHEFFNNCDIAILSAAVADFTPKTVASQKIKKDKNCLTLELTKTKDILTSLSKIKKRQFLVGFALETQNELENAKTKLKKKNLDLIVLNSLNDQGAGFKINTNKITLISKDNKIIPYEVKSKKEVAFDILKYIIREIHV
ncbi:bifunctional phosphopantothenoylcysteine decarboxylase/phosphopantothenate--cysteine ligase CoaBC [Flavobacteriaceae bacterium]|nr:bifunctional phosphopantothenoylcysteine decarboxylase/phosphopantothenate--cysteine ligase CoaBC [Flavobacteriaceae bacterium]